MTAENVRTIPIMRKFLTAAFCSFMSMTIATYAADNTALPQVKNYQAPGNLESKHEVGCVGPGKLSNEYTPADLYRALSKCVESSQYKEGVLLFALAGVYGRFDSLRVEDKTAHQAVAVLTMQALGSQGKKKQAAFQEILKKTLGNREGLAATCKDIVQLGPPNYYPRYMIQHGMGAFSKSGSGDGLVKDFDTKSAWKRSLDTYLHCPGL